MMLTRSMWDLFDLIGAHCRTSCGQEVRKVPTPWGPKTRTSPPGPSTRVTGDNPDRSGPDHGLIQPASAVRAIWQRDFPIMNRRLPKHASRDTR